MYCPNAASVMLCATELVITRLRFLRSSVTRATPALMAKAGVLKMPESSPMLTSPLTRFARIDAVERLEQLSTTSAQQARDTDDLALVEP